MDKGNRQKPVLSVNRQNLECPVCLELPPSEIFNCQTGHSVCKGCSRRLVICALCQRPMTSSRNFMVEALIADYKMSIAPELRCPNQSEGCQFVGKADQVQKHKVECEYRPVQCLNKRAPLCPPTSIKLSNYLNHFLRVHKIIGDQQESIGIANKVDWYALSREKLLKCESEWPPFFTKYNGHVFIRFCRAHDKKLYWWIKVIGPDHLASKYTGRILIENPSKEPSLSVGWEVPVYSLRASDTDIMSDPNNSAVLPMYKIQELSPPKWSQGILCKFNWDCRIVVIRK